MVKIGRERTKIFDFYNQQARLTKNALKPNNAKSQLILKTPEYVGKIPLFSKLSEHDSHRDHSSNNGTRKRQTHERAES